jgi:hypothetical protein
VGSTGDDREVFSFSCIDADARDALDRANARRMRIAYAWPKPGRSFWTAVVLIGVMIAPFVFRSTGVVFVVVIALIVGSALLSRLRKELTEPRAGGVEAQFSIAITDTELEAGAVGKTPMRVPAERIVEVVADDRLRVALDDGTFVVLGCLLAPEPLADLARELNAALRRKRARLGDYRGGIRVSETADVDDVAPSDDALRVGRAKSDR